ncbi:MAG: hypothetical protein ACQCN4_04905, partial [Candidatus Bathyarchaeia archaeon]
IMNILTAEQANKEVSINIYEKGTFLKRLSSRKSQDLLVNGLFTTSTASAVIGGTKYVIGSYGYNCEYSLQD